ncbi:MAG TPA: hypothetical protein VGZ90_07685 [Puia sp.]|jgi:hypothetical protein|nr:hypothetical protein [Puia sp.]
MNLPIAFPVLKTRRLILRRLVPVDRKAIFILRNDEQVSMFIKRNIMTNETEAAADNDNNEVYSLQHLPENYGKDDSEIINK